MDKVYCENCIHICITRTEQHFTGKNAILDIPISADCHHPKNTICRDTPITIQKFYRNVSFFNKDNNCSLFKEYGKHS